MHRANNDYGKNSKTNSRKQTNKTKTKIKTIKTTKRNKDKIFHYVQNFAEMDEDVTYTRMYVSDTHLHTRTFT